MLELKDGFWVFNKVDRVGITPHFTAQEFACPCTNDSCVNQIISKELVDKLEVVRTIINLPVSISSGYRCLAHQAELAAKGYETAKGISQHSLGKAADLLCNNLTALETELRTKFMALGISRRFIHVDLRNDAERVWFYKS